LVCDATWDHIRVQEARCLPLWAFSVRGAFRAVPLAPADAAERTSSRAWRWPCVEVLVRDASLPLAPGYDLAADRCLRLFTLFPERLTSARCCPRVRQTCVRLIVACGRTGAICLNSPLRWIPLTDTTSSICPVFLQFDPCAMGGGCAHTRPIPRL